MEAPKVPDYLPPDLDRAPKRSPTTWLIEVDRAFALITAALLVCALWRIGTALQEIASRR